MHMKPEKVAAYFNALAPEWDKGKGVSQTVLQRVLGIADIRPGDRVLDVGCGTGALTRGILDREADSVLGIDLSPEMIARAREKFSGEDRAQFQVLDAQEASLEQAFDRALAYNAFPHFPSPERLFEAMYRSLDASGRFTVAHGAGREAVNARHHAAAAEVSRTLPKASALALTMEKWFFVDTVVDEGDFYAVSGVRRPGLG